MDPVLNYVVITCGHVTSFPVTWVPPFASYRPVEAQTYPKPDRPSTATSRWLPVKWRHFRVTSNHVRSHDVIPCHMTAIFCELQPVGSQTYPNLHICDPLRNNPAHPAKIDFLLEAIIVTKVTFWRKRDYCSNGSADPWTKRYQSMKPGSAFFPAL